MLSIEPSEVIHHADAPMAVHEAIDILITSENRLRRLIRRAFSDELTDAQIIAAALDLQSSFKALDEPAATWLSD